MMNSLIKIDEISNSINEIDLFICSSSFEARCFTVSNLVRNTIKHENVLVFFNDNEYNEIITNATKLEQLFEGKAKKISLNTNTPAINAIRINDALDHVLNKTQINRILLDTTTFTHETLLILIKLLYFKKGKYSELRIIYIGASNYSINEIDPFKKWLSTGISNIRSIIGYPGVLSPARKNHLIVLFGFESDRTKCLIENMQFDIVSLGFGAVDRSINVDHQRINYARHCELMDFYPNSEKFELSLINPYETKNDILKQIAKYPDFNTVIAPMNNKISAVGAALVSIENPSIQLIYVKPVDYNTSGYSDPSKYGYVFNLFDE